MDVGNTHLAKNLSAPQRLARLGQINYVNSLPITLPIARGMINIDAEVHLATPAELNLGYSEARLDLGAMSTFFYLQNGGLNLFSNLSISSQGPVGSVLFFSKRKLEAINSLNVTVSSASATSVNLLSVLLQEEFQIVPKFNYCPLPDLAAHDADAVLVIGDQALKVDGRWTKLAERIDLGEWWLSRFELPMVFAVWAARTDWQRLHGDQLRQIARCLEESLAIGLSEGFDQVVAEAVERTGLPANRLKHYFREELDFSFSPKHTAGLNRYKSLCEKHGLLGHYTPDRRVSWLPIG
jgi:chorismate dehydratase